MKKIVGSIGLLLILSSCAKDKSVCWHCVLTNTVTNEYSEKHICNDGTEPGIFTDAQGNKLNSYCTKQ